MKVNLKQLLTAGGVGCSSGFGDGVDQTVVKATLE